MYTATPDAPVTTTVAALSDRHLLRRIKELTALEHHLEVVVIDHLRELHRRRLYLTLGYSSLFDYAVRELGYSEAAAWRRIKAMRLCAGVDGARERLQDGSLTMNAAAQLQNAFDRQERKQAGGGRNFGAEGRGRPGEAPNGSAPGAPAPSTQAQAAQPQAGPVLDGSARQALVEQAAGKSTRQVQELLAAVDPELSAPADRVRPLGAGRWEIKAVIDDDCRQGLERLKGLLSHVDPHLTLGQLIGRLVTEGLDRHDPARPPRRRRTGSRTEAGVADKTSAPKDADDQDAVAVGRDAAAAGRTALPEGVATSAAKEQADSEHRRAVTAKRPAVADRTATSAAKEQADSEHRRAVTAKRPAVADRTATSAAKEQADSERRRAAAAKRPAAVDRTATSAPKDKAGTGGAAPWASSDRPAESGASPPKVGPVTSAPKSERKPLERPPSEPKRPASAAPAKAGIRAGRAIPAAVRRQVWARDRGCCSYVDRASGRRCGSRHLLQMDHVVPYALGGSAEPDNLRLLCAAHHRHRHADRAAARR